MRKGFRLGAVGCLRVALAVVVIVVAHCTAAQVLDEAPTASAGRVLFGPPDTIRIRVGAELTGRGVARNVVASVAVPLDCPEQQVRIIGEDISGNVGHIDYRPVAGGEVK